MMQVEVSEKYTIILAAVVFMFDVLLAALICLSS